MSFEKVVPQWDAVGSEPPSSLKTTGFQAGYKPPAAYFNWFWHGVSEALAELQRMKPRTIGAMAEEAIYYNSGSQLDLDTALNSLMLVDKSLAKDCPVGKDTSFVFIMQLFFGTPSATGSRTQIAFPYGAIGNLAGGVAVRCCYNGAWGNWAELYGPHNKPSVDDVIPTTLGENKLPVIPATKGGTGATGWHQALTNLRAMERQAVYYSSSYAPDIDKLTDSLMLIPNGYSKNCPVGGGFVYIMQVFYGDITATSARTQIALPYYANDTGAVGKGFAYRAYSNGVWTEWKEVGSTPYTYSKTDLSAGVSELEEGKLYIVYE